MKKNNKGFTLVELLAALVILGLLVALTMPTILNLLSNNRDKVYVSDAKKLIARAEYKIRASSSVIEKPDSDSNDCIVISLVFLNNSDFNTPPNNGKYLEEASFVVIRFVNNKLEYSATLVEEMKKGGYRGVELTKDVNLVSNSTKHVVNFDKSDLIFVENNDMSKKYGGNIVSDNFINSKLGTNYVGNISNIYNYPDLADSVSNSTYSIPKIVSASMKSAINKDYNTLQAQLKLVVADSDTPVSKLKVYIGFDKYPDYNKVFTARDSTYSIDTAAKFVDTMYMYGSNAYFTLNIDYSAIGKTYNGEEQKLYIYVVDPQGNPDNRIVRYKLYNNNPPSISDQSSITKRQEDAYNLNHAVVYSPITDDIDNPASINVCVNEYGSDISYCDSNGLWSTYGQIFNESKMNYTFNCPSSGCNYDGSTKNLYIIAKDSHGKYSTKELHYTFFNNRSPEASSITLSSDSLNFIGQSNALGCNVKITVEDEEPSTVNIKISENPNFENAVVVTGSTADFKKGKHYNFSGYYDGEDRTLYYQLTDKYGKSSDVHSVTYSNIYRNAAPVITASTNSAVTSKDKNTYVCPNTHVCNTDGSGGAYETSVSFTIVDDINGTSNLSYCISENRSDCTTYNSSKFSTYAPGETVDYTFASPSSGNKYKLTNAQTAKKLYISAYDNYGSFAAISDVIELDYTLYKDVAPIVSKLDIKPVGKLNNNDGFNSRNIQLLLYATDDIDSPSNLTYLITESRAGSSDKTKTGKLSECSKSSDGAYIIDYVISGKYDGGSVTFNASVTDSSGYTGSLAKPSEYTIYQNEKPIITNFSIESSGQPCLSDSGFCTTYGNKDVNISFTTSDDLTATNNLDVAIIDGSTSGCSSATYTKFKDLNFVNGKIAHSLPVSNADKPYDGSTKTVSICVKDEDGSLSFQSNTYTLYNNKVVRFNTGYPKIENYKYNPNNTNYNLKQFTYKLDVTDDFISPSDYASNFKMDICYKAGEFGVEKCTSKMDYQSSYTMTLSDAVYDGTTYYIYSHVYDSYNAPATSSQLIYTIYNDTHPRISNFDIEANVGTDETYDVKLNFTVNDMFDTYTYCVSDNGECTDYSSTPLDGYCSGNTSCNLSHEYIYHTDWATNVKDDHFVNLFVKDSHGNVDVSTIQVTYADGDEEKHLCEQTSPLDVTMTLRDDIANNDDISADRCNNRCYYWSPELEYHEDVEDYVEIPGTGSKTKDIHTFYSRHEVSHDLRHTKVLCKDDSNTEFPVHCDFYKCFKDPNSDDSYAVKSVGMKLIDSEAWTHSGPDGQHTNTNYYRVYTSVYDAADDNKIRFDRLGTTKICPQCLANAGDSSFAKATYSEANFGHFVIIDDRTFEGE